MSCRLDSKYIGAIDGRVRLYRDTALRFPKQGLQHSLLVGFVLSGNHRMCHARQKFSRKTASVDAAFMCKRYTQRPRLQSMASGIGIRTGLFP